MSEDEPRYLGSASYAPCDVCAEGAVVWDPKIDESRCGGCGATS